jgi:hypothetical protein
MRSWFILFTVSIGIGGAFALMVALMRTPVVSAYLPSELFSHWLIGHVDTALIIGLFSFLIFLWHRVFGAQAKVYELIPFWAGLLIITYSAAAGLGKPVQNNYFPTIMHPSFYGGAFLLGLSLALSSIRFLLKALRLHTLTDPIRTALAVSILLTLMVLLSTALSLRDYSAPLEPEILLERLYWFPGHIHQFINASLLISLWFLLSRLAGKKDHRFLGFLSLPLLGFPSYYLYLQATGVDPLSSQAIKMTTLGYQLGIGIPTLILALYFLVFSSFRRDSYSVILGISVLLYFFGAGTGYLIAGSDLRIPAHYHGVMASILTAIMGISYFFLKDLRFTDRVSSLIRWQPALYGVGMILFSGALFWAGYFGAPRKTPGTEYIADLNLYLFMGLVGAGSVLSVLSGVIYVLFILKSVIFRRVPSHA